MSQVGVVVGVQDTIEGASLVEVRICLMLDHA